MTIRDREQKQRSLDLCISNRWFPQLEVEVHTQQGVSIRTLPATDVDVLASIPDFFSGFRIVLFDCKTRQKESAVNRSFWLSGLIQRMGAVQGFCILKKELLALDHKLLAADEHVILLSEEEFFIFVATTSAVGTSVKSNAARLDAWDELALIPSRYSALEQACKFIRSGYWMLNDAAEATRKCISNLKEIGPELDPKKREHFALYLEFASLFSRSTAVIANVVFRTHIHPKSQQSLSDALLVMLYGGRDAYNYRNQIYKRLAELSSYPEIPDLSLPMWDKFLRLFRQLLDAPMEVQRVPLILREIGFGLLLGDVEFALARQLCAESPQAARFSVLITSYLSKATKLPHEFGATTDKILLSIQPVR